MPNTDGHTVIEMPERGRAATRADPTAVHRGAQPSSRGPSPSPSRARNHLTASNGHLNMPHPEDNHLAIPTRHRRDTSSDRDDHMQPLLEADANKPRPPLAGPEIDEDLDDHHGVPATADHHPGIDDGFFNSDGEHDTPSIDNRFGDDEKTDGDHKNGDDIDGVMHGYDGNYLAVPTHMMYTSQSGRSTPNGYHPRFKPDAPLPMPEYVPVTGPDVNVYQQKKNLAQGMMDLALFSANANQLRYVLEAGSLHPYYVPSLIFIAASLILQIAVGVGLILNSRYNVNEHDDRCKADKVNDLTVVGIFLITIVNVFVASFGVATSPYVQPVVQSIQTQTALLPQG